MGRAQALYTPPTVPLSKNLSLYVNLRDSFRFKLDRLIAASTALCNLKRVITSTSMLHEAKTSAQQNRLRADLQYITARYLEASDIVEFP